MKALNRILCPGFGASLIASLGLACSSLAQTVPVVTLQATDPTATWAGDTGTFTVFRAGDASQNLNVFYRIFGTATNGVDYQTISNFVQIPAGTYSNSIVITPLNHGQTLGRTVSLVLSPTPWWMPPMNYMIGYPSNATVFILGSSNLPPLVNLVSPMNGSVFYTPVNIPLFAHAADLDGYVTNVEFFANGSDLGPGRVVTMDPSGSGYALVWSNAPAGTNSLTAVASDNLGASSTSAVVNVTVLAGPPPTNFPPVVRIMSPPNGAIFRAPADIPIFAYAADFDGTVSSVEFFAGTNSLGFGQQVVPPPSPWPMPTNVWSLVWSNAPLGTNIALRAKATDNGGATSVSFPVFVSVLASLPPPTNNPPLVSIVATDPVAIEGTNCWPWLGLTNTCTWSNWFGPGVFCQWFTNCGPKNATFTVFRYGATNDDLFVTYNLGGTATNGVDYVPLSGEVTIPAGHRRAQVTVVPLDDGPPDITSTVLLHLTPGTNYLLGFPRGAGAIILDSQTPHLSNAMLSGNTFNLSASGPDGAWYHVEYSTDLLNWTPICTNQVVNGTIDFVDPDAAGSPARFYRAVPESAPPLQ